MNWCFWAVLLQKTLESPLDCKIKPVTPKGNQSWIFITRTDAEAPIPWPPDGKSQLIRKDPDISWERVKAGEGDDRGWDGWMASPTQWTWVWANSRRWWRAGSLTWCCPWGRKELDTTEPLNNNNYNNLSPVPTQSSRFSQPTSRGFPQWPPIPKIHVRSITCESL